MDIHFAEDNFLSLELKRHVFKLSLDDSVAGAGISEWLDSAPCPLLVYAKVSVEDIARLSMLETAGFRVVDVNVQMEMPAGGHPLSGNTIIREAVQEDRSSVERIASGSFVYSRFHLDPAIPDELANNIKGKWAGNYFDGRRGSNMIVAEAEGTIAGFLQLLRHEDVLTIDLIAVEHGFRRREAAADMISYAVRQLGGISAVRVGTQIANIPAMRMYMRMGFSVSDAQYVLHCHR